MSTILSLIPDKLQEISLEQALKAYLLDCQARNLSTETIFWYRQRITWFYEFLKARTALSSCPVSLLHEENIRLFIQHQKEKENRLGAGRRLSSTTIRGMVVSLKAFSKFLHEEGYLKENVAAKIKSPKIQKKIIETFSPEQIKALLNAPDKKNFTGFRDYCILLTFFDTGIRLSELMNLRLTNIDFSGNTLLVLGKGNKERRVPFGNGLRKALEKYITWRGNIAGQDILFVSQFGEKLKKRRIQEMVTACGKKAGITGVRMSPHTFRHTFAKLSLLNGLDVITLQYILGHSSLEMVRHYVNLTQQEVALKTHRCSLLDKLAESGQATLPRRKIL